MPVLPINTEHTSFVKKFVFMFSFSLLWTSYFLFIYLVMVLSFTLMCSPEAFGNILTLPTQHINPADFKKMHWSIFAYHMLTFTLTKIFLMMLICKNFLASRCLYFHPAFWDLSSGSTYQLRIITQSVQQWLLQDPVAVVGSEHHHCVLWTPVGSLSCLFLGVSLLGKVVIPEVRELN